uniref:hypothetical protein n=1 Tax=Staphylococcus succinus TaxID=61015 RepID=UPI003F578194
AHKILICVLSLTRLNQQFNVVFGINVDILRFSFQCSFLQSQELIIQVIETKVNNFFELIFSESFVKFVCVCRFVSSDK